MAVAIALGLMAVGVGMLLTVAGARGPVAAWGFEPYERTVPVRTRFGFDRARRGSAAFAMAWAAAALIVAGALTLVASAL